MPLFILFWFVMTMRFQQIPIQAISPNPNQPRHKFDAQQLQELADSIESQGLIEPLIVRPDGSQYCLIAGERRWRAASLLALDMVPCVIVEYTEEQAAAVTLIENIQRVDLTLIEEARGYQQLQKDFELQQDDIARLVGKSRSHIANLLRLLTLDEQIQTWVCEGKLSFGHARTLVGLPVVVQRRFGLQAIRHHWSVRQMENQVKDYKTSQESSRPNKSSDVIYLEDRLSEQLGTKVVCEPNAEAGGWLRIKYYDNETLAGILNRLDLNLEEYE